MTLKPQFLDRIKVIDSQLSKLEKEKCFTELDNTISKSEISNTIGKIKNEKSPGLDRVSNKMIKHSQTVLLPILHKNFNKCLTYDYYPTSWSSGYITAIYKNNNIDNPNNYRDITVTHDIGKLYNRILDMRLEHFLENRKLINVSQIGFKRKVRTPDHTFVLKTIIDKCCNSKEGRVFACFVDF